MKFTFYVLCLYFPCFYLEVDCNIEADNGKTISKYEPLNKWNLKHLKHSLGDGTGPKIEPADPFIMEASSSQNINKPVIRLCSLPTTN